MSTSAKKVILFFALFLAVYLHFRAEQTVKAVRESRSAIEQAAIQREQFMARALELTGTSASDDQGLPGGSIVVKGEKVIGEGRNNNKLLNDPEAHAEVSSIIRACRNLGTNDLAGADIYTTVQPCPRCLSMIGTIGIENVYYCVPRWKLKQFDYGHSQEYVIELMARSRMTSNVHEIQVVDKPAYERLPVKIKASLSLN